MVSRSGPRVLGATLVVAVAVGGCVSDQNSASPGGTTTATGSDLPAATAGSSSSPAAASEPSSATTGTTGTETSGNGGGAGAGTLQQAFESVVQSVGPSVVLIETDQGLGSGVVLDDHGDVVTNAHVVAGASQFDVVTASGDRRKATLVGAFPNDDIAVVKAADGTLEPATFANSDDLKVGQIVLAIGNPLGLQSSVTEGIVSAVGRTVNEENGVALPGVIQTSAAINPGNSGGALVDLSGAVVGIPTLTAVDPQIGGAANGIGFAIPSNIAKDIGSQLAANGKVVNSHRAYLGVRLANVTGADGAYVYSVDKGGPADKAGVPADVLITAIDGKATPDQPTLASVLAGLQPGQQVEVRLQHRDGSTDTVTVTLGELPG